MQPPQCGLMADRLSTTRPGPRDREPGLDGQTRRCGPGCFFFWAIGRGDGVRFGFGDFTRCGFGAARVVTDPTPVLVRGRGGGGLVRGPADPGLRNVAMSP